MAQYPYANGDDEEPLETPDEWKNVELDTQTNFELSEATGERLSDEVQNPFADDE